MERNARHQSPVSYKSRVELYDELGDVRRHLSSDCDIDSRVEALQRLERVVVEAAHAGVGGLHSALNSLLESLQGAFIDGRFKLVSQVCHLVSSLAEAMKASFEPIGEFLFMDLLNVLSLAASFSDAAHKAILAILSNCPPMTFLDPILVEVRESRSATVRIRCAEYVRHTLLCWGMHPESPLAQVQGDLEAFIRTGVEDAAREVRSEARQCFRVYCRLWPERESTLRSYFDPSVLKVLSHEDKAMAYARKQVQDPAQANVQQPRGPASPQRSRSPTVLLPWSPQTSSVSPGRQATASTEGLTKRERFGDRSGEGGTLLREQQETNSGPLVPSSALFRDLESNSPVSGLPAPPAAPSLVVARSTRTPQADVPSGQPSAEHTEYQAAGHRQAVSGDQDRDEVGRGGDEDAASESDSTFKWVDATALALSQRLDLTGKWVPLKDHSWHLEKHTPPAPGESPGTDAAHIPSPSGTSRRVEPLPKEQEPERHVQESLASLSLAAGREGTASTTSAVLSSIKENIMPPLNAQDSVTPTDKAGVKPATLRSLSMSRAQVGTSPSRCTSPSQSKVGSPRAQSPKRDVSPAGSSVSLPSRRDSSPRLGRVGLSDRSTVAASPKGVNPSRGGLASSRSSLAQARTTTTSATLKASPAAGRVNSHSSAARSVATARTSSAEKAGSLSSCSSIPERRPATAGSPGTANRGVSSTRAGSPSSVCSRGSSTQTPVAPAKRNMSSPGVSKETPLRGMQARDSSPGASSTTSTRSRSTLLASPTASRGASARLTPGGAFPARDSSPGASSTTSSRSRMYGQASPTSTRLTGSAKTSASRVLSARDNSPGASSTTSSRSRGARLASPTSGQDKRPRLTGRLRDVGSVGSRSASDRSLISGLERGPADTLDSSSTGSISRKLPFSPGASSASSSRLTSAAGKSSLPRMGLTSQRSPATTDASRTKAGSSVAAKGLSRPAGAGLRAETASSRLGSTRSSALVGGVGKTSVADVVRSARGREDWTQRVKSLTALQGILRGASPGGEGTSGKLAADLVRHMEAVGDMLASSLDFQHSKVSSTALGCLKDLVGCFSSQPLSVILADRWLPAALVRAADTTQPSLRQLALSVLDLMRDSFAEEMLLVALEDSLQKTKSGKAKARAMEFGTALVQSLAENRLKVDTQDRIPAVSSTVEMWGTTLLRSSSEPRLRPECLKGINACSALIGPQFIVTDLQSLDPVVSRDILVSMAKAYPSLCRRVMQSLLQSQDLLRPDSSAAEQGRKQETPGTPPIDPAWVVMLSDVAHALQSSSHARQVPPSSCSGSELLSVDEGETDASRGYPLSPSRTLSMNSDRSSTAWLRSTATDLSLLSEAQASVQMVDEDGVREAAGRIFRYFCQMEKGPAAAKAAALRTIEEAAKQQRAGLNQK